MIGVPKCPKVTGEDTGTPARVSGVPQPYVSRARDTTTGTGVLTRGGAA